MLRQLVAIAILLTANSAQATQSLWDKTAEEYVAHVGADARIVPAGEFKLDGHRLYCGTRPTVIDNKLDDYAASYPGYVIMNCMTSAPSTISRREPARSKVTPTLANRSSDPPFLDDDLGALVQPMSAFDPKRTLRAFDANRIKHRSLKIQPHDTNGRSGSA